MMNRICLIFLLLTSTFSNTHAAQQGACYLATIKNPAIYATNTWKLCVESKNVESTIFFENPGKQPNTCLSQGNITAKGSKLVIKLNKGMCQNNEPVGNIDLTCSLLGDTLACSDKGRRVIFERTDKGFFLPG